jgi:zinc D-Ala-D-Ala carboxypeptidase
MLSQHFSLAEMVESATARRLQIKEQFTPSPQIVNNLTLLCTNLLEPLRQKVGAIVVTSGYRCPRVNKAVGGVVTSQHLLGQAADIYAINISKAALFETIKQSNLPFDQLIWEYGTQLEPAWVHVSFSTKPRRQILFIGVNKK